MRLRVIGVGPGDPGLITLKGYQLINSSRLVFYPTGGKDALALSIVKRLLPLDDKELVELHFPMKKGSLKEHWTGLVSLIIEYLQKYVEGVFITLGDPAFYCTFYYLFPYLVERGVEIKFIPGISSFSAGSSLFSIPLALGEDIVAVVPGERFKREWERLQFFDTIVVLKAKNYLREIVDTAKLKGFKVYVGYRITQEEEVLLSDIENFLVDEKVEHFDYFTLTILRRG